MLNSKGRSKRARHLRKQLELVALCKNAATTNMKSYLSVLVVLIEAIHAFRFFLKYFCNNNKIFAYCIKVMRILTKAVDPIHLMTLRIQIRIRIQLKISMRIRIWLRIRLRIRIKT